MRATHRRVFVADGSVILRKSRSSMRKGMICRWLRRNYETECRSSTISNDSPPPSDRAQGAGLPIRSVGNRRFAISAYADRRSIFDTPIFASHVAVMRSVKNTKRKRAGAPRIHPNDYGFGRHCATVDYPTCFVEITKRIGASFEIRSSGGLCHVSVPLA